MVQSMGRPCEFHVVSKFKRCSKCICMVLISMSNICKRLAIRFQLRTYGSQYTLEEAQVIEHKCSRLQKLIDMFEHQADLYLLRHRATDEAPISPLGDYSEYDNVDNLEDSNVPNPIDPLPLAHRHTLHSSDGSDMDNINAEDISILLPSSLGWEWCVRHSVQSLVEKEARLRHAQAIDSIHSMRFALGFKSALFHDQVCHANTQRTKTHAWDAIHSVDTTVHQHARNYSMVLRFGHDSSFTYLTHYAYVPKPHDSDS